MAWRKDKKEDGQVHRRKMATYNYHNSRNNQDDSGTRRDTKKQIPKPITSATTPWLEKFGLIILVLAVAASLVSILYVSNSSNVIVEGSTYTKEHFNYSSQVEEAASKLISGSIFNRNKVTINTNNIEKTLEADFPMYTKISVTLPFIDHHPVIYITEAQPAVVLTNSSEQYLLNSNGQIMLPSSAVSSYKNLQIPQVSYSGFNFTGTGQQVLTPDEISFIQTIVFELSIKGQKVSTIDLVQGTSQINVNITGQPYYVKFNLENNDPRQQAGSYIAAQQYLKSQNITPSQYIDARTDGRIYYQ